MFNTGTSLSAENLVCVEPPRFKGHPGTCTGDSVKKAPAQQLTRQDTALLRSVIRSEIPSQPDNLPIYPRLLGQREIVIFPIEWVKDILPPELLELA